jgi:hypothetical protein
MPLYRRTFVLSLFALLATSLGSARATCTGADPGSACKNCEYCKRCSKDGKTCGTCKRSLERSHTTLVNHAPVESFRVCSVPIGVAP